MEKRKSLITKIAIALAGVGLVIFLFNRPKSVVSDNDQVTAGETTANTVVEEENIEESHLKLDSAELARIERLKENLTLEDNVEKFSNFADSLAALFRSVGAYDSVAYYKEMVFERLKTPEAELAVADALFDLTEVSPPKKSTVFARRALEHYKNIESYFTDLEDVKVKSAVLLVLINASEGKPPMQGINILKGIVEANPQNILANQYLGEFYMRISGGDVKRIEKAIVCFENIVKKDQRNIRAHMNLLECYLSLNNKSLATRYYNQLKSLVDTGDKFLSDYLARKLTELNEL